MYEKKAQELFDYTVDIRRKIHENPELSGQEEKTVELVKKELKEIGIDFVDVNKGGVLGFIEGNQKSDNPKTIILRADLDALPFEETEKNLKNNRLVKSKNPGAMHACGHDGHTAILLTAAKILNENKDDFAGRIILCFERGEEFGLNYKYLMAYLGKNEVDIDSSFAIHVSPEYESGVMAIKSGGINAGAMMFDVTIKGESGHGSRPYMANNPLDCFVDIYNELKSLRMNKFSPFEPMTYSIGAVEMGNQFNQIPDKLRFKGSVRFFDRKEVGYRFYREFQSLIINKVKSHNCRVVFNEYTRPHFPIINDEKLANLAKNVMADELGEDYIANANPSMGSDSFAIYTAQWPGLYLMLGIKNEELGSGAALHSSKFDLDENALKNGVAATVRYVVEYLNSDIKLEDGPYKNNIKGLFIEENRSQEEIEEIYDDIA
ncbi:M20 family metallopeptidase [Anaerococcus sp. ENR0831]|uniref:M20 family metallopeptidase n=1 Tax=Anaerococcus martiniensis TaxID=3115615 RepID=A0ABW9MD44_9FIRM